MPWPSNQPDPQDPMTLPIEEIADLQAETLAALQEETDAQLKAARAAVAKLEQALAIRYADKAATARRQAGKDTGTVRIEDGGFTVVADLPKKVDWDQAQLAAMVARIRVAGEDPAEYVDISYRVPERKYVAWPESIREGFEPARTVRPGKPTFRLTLDGEDA